MEKEPFDGNYKKSTTNFKTHGLKVDIQLDGRSLVDSPVEMKNSCASSFYYKFLIDCNMLNNINSSGMITYNDFYQQNFFFIENLTKHKAFNGQLTLNLEFGDV